MVPILFLMVHIRPLEIILAKKTTELVLLFQKNITKLVFLWPNLSQKCFKELIVSIWMLINCCISWSKLHIHELELNIFCVYQKSIRLKVWKNNFLDVIYLFSVVFLKIIVYIVFVEMTNLDFGPVYLFILAPSLLVYSRSKFTC